MAYLKIKNKHEITLHENKHTLPKFGPNFDCMLLKDK